MAKSLESNLWIRTKVPAPEGKGFHIAETKLDKILSTIAKINATPIRIKVDLTGDVAAISSLKQIIKVSGKAFAGLTKEDRSKVSSGKKKSAGPTANTIGKGGFKSTLSADEIRETRTDKFDKDGGLTQRKKAVQRSVVTGDGKEITEVDETDFGLPSSRRKTTTDLRADKRRSIAKNRAVSDIAEEEKLRQYLEKQSQIDIDKQGKSQSTFLKTLQAKKDASRKEAKEQSDLEKLIQRESDKHDKQESPFTKAVAARKEAVKDASRKEAKEQSDLEKLIQRESDKHDKQESPFTKAAAANKASAKKATTDRDALEKEGQRNADKASQFASPWQQSINAKKAADKQAEKDANELKRINDLADRRTNAVNARKTRLSQTESTLTAAGFRVSSAKDVKQNVVSGSNRQVTGRVQEFRRERSDGSEEVLRFNTLTNQKTKLIDTNTKAVKDNAKIQQLANSEVVASGRAAILAKDGFSQYSQQVKNFTVAGKNLTSTVTEFRKTSGSIFSGNFQVEIAKVDSSTGKMTSKILTGKEAVRAFGDSFSSAVSKVGLWFLATTAIFQFSNLMQSAASQMKDLESNSVFLARVGGEVGKSFEENYVGAKLLTNQIIELSTVYGVDAVEAQRSASVFLRSGQTKSQALESVRASIIATRIAELSGVEASELLESARLQFKLRADQLLPTLDSANTLSNKYRVSTDDLLQSVSRAGSVYAESNGSLEQLLATTALIAQTTGRTGAEIGNALKTIQSRLVSPETSSDLLERTGISLQYLSGESKSLGKVLLQLQSAMDKMSESDKRQLVVRIAGARQANILQSALDSVIDSVLAEAKALRDSGSALIEAGQTSITLESTLGRVSAQFTKLINETGSGLGSLAKSVVSAVEGLLKLANAFGALPVKIGLFVIAATLMRMTVLKVGVAFQWFALELATGSTALQALIGTFGKMNLIALGLTAIVGALVYVYDRFANSTARARAENEALLESMRNSAEAADRRARATAALTDALNEQLDALAELNREEKKTGKTPETIKRRAEIEQRVKRLQAGEEEGGTGAGGKVPNTNEEIDSAKKKSRDKNKKDADAAIKAKELEVKAESESVPKSQERVNEKEKEIKILKQKKAFQQDDADNMKRHGWTLGGADSKVKRTQEKIDKLEKQLNEENKALGDQKVRAREAAVELEALRKTKENLNKETLLEDNKTVFLDKGTRAEGILNKFNKFDKQGGDLGLDGPAFQVKQLENSIKDLTVSQDLAKESLIGLRNESDTRRFKQLTDVIQDTTEALVKQRQELKKIKIADQTSSYTKILEASDRIYNAKNKKKILENSEKGLSGGGRFAEISVMEGEKDLNKKRMAMTLIELNRNGKAIAGNPRGAFAEVEHIALAQASAKEVSDLANRNREIGISIIEKEYELETEITKERKKQNEETMKSLGLLSNEDKLKVLLQADYFRKNPNAKITEEQQFFANAEDNKILNENFGAYAKDFDHNAKDGLFAGVNIGPRNKELDLAEAELNKRNRNPLTVQQRNEQAIVDAGASNIFEGKDEWKGQGFKQFSDHEMNKINVNVDDVNMRALVDEFQNVSVVQMTNLRDSLMAQVMSISEKIRNIPGVDIEGRFPAVQQ